MFAGECPGPANQPPKWSFRKVHFCGDFSGGFWFFWGALFSRNSTRKPSNLIKSPVFYKQALQTLLVFTMPLECTLLIHVHNLEGKRTWAIAKLRGKRDFIRTPPNRYGPSSSLSKQCRCLPLQIWCSEGHLGSIWPGFRPCFWPVLSQLK